MITNSTYLLKKREEIEKSEEKVSHPSLLNS